MERSQCIECGASFEQGKTCRDYVNELIKWDFEDFLGVGQVHHLTVVCYNLQHPSVYSKKGLEDAKQFLEEFVVRDISFADHDARNRERLSSSVRDWKISGTEEDHGSYETRPSWEILAPDIVAGGLDHYVENVKDWSRHVYSALKETGNI